MTIDVDEAEYVELLPTDIAVQFPLPSEPFTTTPPLTVSELLKILGITKQSLGRVLNDLSARGLVENRAGISDRRQKLLRLTAQGMAFETQLFEALRNGMSSAYAAAGQESITGFWRVLEGLVPEEDRSMVLKLQGVDA